ncbi:MAG: spore coat protein, partial [Cyclobacteriaceae bacterium]
MKMLKSIKTLLKISLYIFLIGGFVACSDDNAAEDVLVGEEEEVDGEAEVEDDTNFVATDWTTETHTKDVDPNFDEVFDDTAVKRFDIVITAARWQSMLDDMTSNYGVFGATNSGGPGVGLAAVDEDPIFVPAEIFYNGKEWY